MHHVSDAYDYSRARKRPDAWWTVAVIDPVAVRLLPLLVPRRRVTPDGLSLTSLVLAAVAAVLFATGHVRLGAGAFELHFLVDCLDGKVARVRGTQNPRGGFVDLACDLVGTTACLAALGHWALAGSGHPTLALLTAVTYVAYTWSTVHRREGATLTAKPARTGGWLERHGMGRLPYGVEVEAVTLFLVPLLAREEPARAALYLAAVFYVCAAGRNLRATWRALPST